MTASQSHVCKTHHVHNLRAMANIQQLLHMQHVTKQRKMQVVPRLM
jgi:hypothetical protein